MCYLYVALIIPQSNLHFKVSSSGISFGVDHELRHLDSPPILRKLTDQVRFSRTRSCNKTSWKFIMICWFCMHQKFLLGQIKFRIAVDFMQSNVSPCISCCSNCWDLLIGKLYWTVISGTAQIQGTRIFLLVLIY